MHDTSQKQLLPHGPLLAAKLHMPPVAPHLVVRPRLLARLSQGMKYKLTPLSTLAGYGSALPPMIVCLLPGSRSIRVITTLLVSGSMCTSLYQIHATVNERILPLLHSSQPPPVDYLLTTLINTLTPVTEDFVLVLDEYHVITTSSIHQELTCLPVSPSGWRAVARDPCGRPVFYTRGDDCFPSISVQ